VQKIARAARNPFRDDGRYLPHPRVLDAVEHDAKASKHAVVFADMSAELWINRLQILKLQVPVFEFFAIDLRTIIKTERGFV
jgi:hypothetical protein